MKIRTKILTAVLAAATAFSCALTASAAPAAPAFTLDNSAAPATVNGSTVSGTLTLKATEFTDVTGALLTVTFPGTVTFAEITDSDWVNGVDYKYDGNTVKLVNVFNIDTTDTSLILNLNFKLSDVNVQNELKVTVSGTYADQQVDKTYPIEATGTITKGKETTNAGTKEDANSEITKVDTTNYFIPYGGVYTVGENNAITYYPKTSANAFDITNGATDVKIIKCPLPASGEVTTFGASKSTITNDEYSSNSIQFGSYIDVIQGNKSFGTIIIASYDLSDKLVKAGYKKGSYENAVRRFGNADALFQNIVTAFQANNKIDGELHPYTYGGTKEVIYAAVVQQTKYMWRNSNENYSKLQYAVRCTGLTTDVLQSKYYTAVGYTVDTADTYKFSNQIQTASYNSLK